MYNVSLILIHIIILDEVKTLMKKSRSLLVIKREKHNKELEYRE